LAECVICGAGIPKWHILEDKSHGCTLLGDIAPFQHVTACIGCDAQMHVKCAQNHVRTMPGHYIRYASMEMRARVDSLSPRTMRLPTCVACYDRLVSDSLRNLEVSGNFELAAQFLEYLGRMEEAGAMRKRGRTHDVRTVQVDLNALIETLTSRGLAVQYRCPSCGASIPIGSGSSQTGVARCAHCESALSIDAIMEVLRAALAR